MDWTPDDLKQAVEDEEKRRAFMLLTLALDKGWEDEFEALFESLVEARPNSREHRDSQTVDDWDEENPRSPLDK